jgi:hypothetical protein
LINNECSSQVTWIHPRQFQSEQANARATYIFLQLSPFRSIWMLTDSKSIQLMTQSSTRSLSSQTGYSPGRQELHGELSRNRKNGSLKEHIPGIAALSYTVAGTIDERIKQ